MITWSYSSGRWPQAGVVPIATDIYEVYNMKIIRFCFSVLAGEGQVMSDSFCCTRGNRRGPCAVGLSLQLGLTLFIVGLVLHYV